MWWQKQSVQGMPFTCFVLGGMGWGKGRYWGPHCSPPAPLLRSLPVSPSLPPCLLLSLILSPVLSLFFSFLTSLSILPLLLSHPGAGSPLFPLHPLWLSLEGGVCAPEA